LAFACGIVVWVGAGIAQADPVGPVPRTALEAVAWTQLAQFLEASGLLLVMSLGVLFWWMRTPDDDLSAIHTAVSGDGPKALSIRRRGQMTHRPSGGACRTYDVVVPAMDGGEHTVIVGVRRTMFGTGPVTLFGADGHAVRTLTPRRTEPASVTPRLPPADTPLTARP